MKPKSFMVIAGEASGDALAAELVLALRETLAECEGKPTSDLQPLRTSIEPEFFGVGGPKMAAAGVDLIFDLTRDAVFGLEVLTRLREFRHRFSESFKVAIKREPDAIICVDFGGFNRRFAHAIKNYVRRNRGPFMNWDPKIIQYVSPQVWASRASRADGLAKDIDLLLAIFPFEKEWYRKRTPHMRVEFVGHPVVDRYAGQRNGNSESNETSPLVVLFPGSRPTELKRHLPILADVMKQMREAKPRLHARMIVPESLVPIAREFNFPGEIRIQSDGLADALSQADLAIAKSGTVTVECAFFGVPTVVLYKASWLTYAIAKRIVQVKYVAMPNLLANEEVFPEFVQGAATPDNIARAALEFLNDPARRNNVKAKLKEIVASLGTPGASRRAAEAIIAMIKPEALALRNESAYSVRASTAAPA